MVQPCGLAINCVILFLLYSSVFMYTLNKFIYAEQGLLMYHKCINCWYFFQRCCQKLT